MSGLVAAVHTWGSSQRAGVTDVAELARLEVVEILAARWARVVVATRSTLPERVAASRELRALLGRRTSQDGRTDDDGSGVGIGVGDQLAALYGPPVAG